LHNIAKNHDVICSLYGKTSEEAEAFEKLFDDHKTVFYDAYIISTHRDNQGKIFASDYITTHHPEDPMGEFKDPTPIKFLKILSEVTWQFQFKAQPDDIELFRKIILDFGLGAKTNVGYGQFEVYYEEKELQKVKKESTEKLKSLQDSLNN
jgi:CRISPR-associated protein Cmr6